MEVQRVEARSAPLWPSAASLMLALIAAALVVFTLDTSTSSFVRFAWAGYAVGAILVPIIVAVHRYLRDEAKSSPYFDPRYLYDKLAAAAMIIGLLAALWHAFVVATELAR